MEPGNLAVISAFRQDRANRLPEQTQRRVYGGAARARRHGGGIMKIFHWEGEPQRELNTATTMSLRTLQLIIQIMAFTYSSTTLLFLCGMIIPYSTYTQLNCTLQAEGLSLLSPPTFYPFTP